MSSLPFSRNNEGVAPQFIPEHEAQPIGSAEAQVSEAMALAKQLNSRPEISLAERIAKIDPMTVATACDFLDGLSPSEREKYLLAEKTSKGRTTILGRYGW